VPPASPPAGPTPPGGAPGGAQLGPKGEFDPWGPNEKNFYGGQQIAGGAPSMGEYGAVQGYADQAYEQARRYLDPQQEVQNDRMAQELINQGIDPQSPQGKARMEQLGRQQADANNAASFGALQFGQGIQSQMSQQELANQGLAGNMQQALWNNQLGSSQLDLQKYLGDQGFDMQRYLGDLQNQQFGAGLSNQRYGMDQNFALGQSGQDLQRYGMDLTNQFNMGGLDMARQGQGFNQMMGLEGVDFRNRAYNDSRGDYQDQLIMAMMGQTPIPGVSQISPGGAFNTTISSAGQDKGWLGNMFG
jgi:hypothetical protein